MNADPHDIRKSAIEDQMISAAEDRAQIERFAKLCYEAAAQVAYPAWENLNKHIQRTWIAKAQAVLAEARRVDWR